MTDLTTSPTNGAPAADAPSVPEKLARSTFDVLPLSRELRETLAEMGYVHPTPVQLAVWEPATRGKDAVVQARTGTGKTAAFGLPIVDHVVRRSVPHAQVLCLCPTRELALQVAGELERLSKRKNIRVLAVYGGAPMPKQIEAIAAGAQVIVGTPGRTLDHIRRGTLDTKHIKLLVLDESDEMLSMGFERELTAILESLPKERQTLLFSATVPPDIERIAKSRLRTPEFITLSGDHIGALEINHFVYMVASDKLSALVRMIEVENPEGAVVFCNTKDETERVAQALSRQGYDADWLNGDLPQDAREKVMTATREGRLRFLVATDVAARGIDISHLTHVINHDFPQDAESYVHRTGRTGRAGRTGTAISLITPHDVGGLYLLRLTYKIRPVEKQIPTQGELKTRAEADLVSMLAEAFLATPAHPDDVALARRLLTHDRADMILAGLLRDHLGARPTAKDEAAAARRATTPPPAPRKAPPPRPAPAPSVRPAAPAPVVAAPAPVAAAPAPVVAAPAPVVPARAPVVAAPAPVQAPRPAPVAPAARPAPVTPAAAPVAPTVQAASPTAPSAPAPRPVAPQGDRRDDRRDPRFRREGTPDAGDNRGAGGSRRREGGRGRSAHTPVSAADGSHEGVIAATGRVPQRHADFSTWQPPEEEGDDQPILGEDSREAVAARSEPQGASRRGGRDDQPRGPGRNEGGAPRNEARRQPERNDRPDRRDRPERNDRPEPAAELLPPIADADLAEIFINVGRREGARAADLQRLLTERAGIDKAYVRRIRVRDRNAFVSVRREDLAKALAALSGATIGGKVASAEQARERGAGDAEGEAEASDRATTQEIRPMPAPEGVDAPLKDREASGQAQIAAPDGFIAENAADAVEEASPTPKLSGAV